MGKKINNSEENKFVMEIWNDSENHWDEARARDLRHTIKQALDYISKNHDMEPDIDIQKIMEKFNLIISRFFNYRMPNTGHAFYMDAMKEFVKVPELMWEAYDAAKDKLSFLEGETEAYSMDKRKNLRIFAQGVFSFLLEKKDPRILEAEIAIYSSIERRNKQDEIVSKCKKYIKQGYSDLEKNGVINALINTTRELEYFGELAESQERYNILMKSLGLTSLTVSNEGSETNTLRDIFSEENLEKYDYFQLQGMLTFFSNRVEKVEENIAKGLFLIYFTLTTEDQGKCKYELSDEILKIAWKEYKIFSKTLESVYGNIGEKCDSIDTIEGLEQVTSYRDEDIYKSFYEGYQDFLGLLVGDRDTEKDCYSFINAVGSTVLNNYALKNALLADLISQAITQNINWGIIEEESGKTLQKKVLIGVDIPGISMPVRLHMPLVKLREITQYLKIEEIPIYVGGEDFRNGEKNIPTPLILPLTPKEKDDLKKAAKQNENPMVKHLATMHLPNPVKKLLKWKTGGRQTHPDYIRLSDGKIRRAAKVEIE